MLSMGRVTTVCTVLVLFVGSVVPAVGQTSARGAGSWEIEGYGGLAREIGSAAGAATLPEPGAPVATSSPIFPSRRVPSWFFGDGAALLNAVNAQFDVAARVQPLDGALGGAGLDSGNQFLGGVRLRRRVSLRYSVEASVDLMNLGGSTAFSSEFESAADATADSFRAAFEGLLATGPFSSIDVQATAGLEDGATREIGLTGAVVYDLSPGARFAPFVTLGGGVVLGTGDAAAATIEGRYQFLIDGQVPVDEMDRVTVRLENRTALVGVVGGGVRQDVSDRWGIRADGRVLIGQRSSRVTLDADPAVAVGSPADYAESLTAPSIQFSNNPSTGRESSLGGPALRDFEAFVGDGLQTRVLVTVGVYYRWGSGL